MSMKFYVVLLIVLLLFCLSVPVIATCEGDPPGNPYCYECDDGVWVLKVWASCGQDSDCTGECHGGCYTYLCTCSDDQSKCTTGECHTCSGGSCTDDNSKCGGFCGNCVNGFCEGCNANNCEICNLGFCVSSCDWQNCYACNGSGTCVYQCNSCELCSSGVCVDCDTDYTSPCSWTWPPLQSGCLVEDPEDKRCTAFEQDKVCHWIVTDYIQPWNDTCPCCTLVTTPCVEVTPALCDDEFRAFVGRICHCCYHEEYGNYGAPYNIGSGTKCPTF